MDLAEFFQKLAEQGVLALIIISFILGLIVPKPSVDRLVKENELKDKIIEQLTAVLARVAEKADK